MPSVVRIEVAFISGKTFIQEAGYSARIVDLQVHRVPPSFLDQEHEI